jgi:hypothetical protein
MADIISSMQSQVSFLAPAIAGIVIGITSMIISILGDLTSKLSDFAKNAPSGTGSGVAGAGLLDMFHSGIPTYFFQIIVGMYVVQIVFILSVLINGIENGADKLSERYLLGRNLINSTILYCIIALTIMLIFNLIAIGIIDSIRLTGA